MAEQHKHSRIDLGSMAWKERDRAVNISKRKAGSLLMQAHWTRWSGRKSRIKA